jgi:hypothetical protein
MGLELSIKISDSAIGISWRRRPQPQIHYLRVCSRCKHGFLTTDRDGPKPTCMYCADGMDVRDSRALNFMSVYPRCGKLNADDRKKFHIGYGL